MKEDSLNMISSFEFDGLEICISKNEENQRFCPWGLNMSVI